MMTMTAPQPDVSSARACASSPPVMRQPAIKVRKIPKVKAVVKSPKSAIAKPQAPSVSSVQVVLGGGHPGLVELIMGLIDNSHGRDPGCPEEKVMQGALSWASLNRTNRALFHHTHLKWWKALLKKHADIDDSTLKTRSVIPYMSDKTYHSFYVDIYRELVRERMERERQEAEAKAREEAKKVLWEAERGISIRRDVEPADHFENTDKYQRWMFHTSKKDPRELELTKMMQRAERLVHHPKHLEDKSQSKECQEMGKLLNALRTRRREWEVFRTSPRPFTQMLGTLTGAVCAMESAMGNGEPSQKPEPEPEPEPDREAWLQAAQA